MALDTPESNDLWPPASRPATAALDEAEWLSHSNEFERDHWIRRILYSKNISYPLRGRWPHPSPSIDDIDGTKCIGYAVRVAIALVMLSAINWAIGESSIISGEWILGKVEPTERAREATALIVRG